MASVSFERVAKAYGRKAPVLRDLTLAVKDGGFLAVVGPSGCGKSTTLNLVAGLEAPTSGVIRIGENDVTHVSPKDRDVAMVFQSYALYPHLTVAGNIAFPLENAGVPAASRKAMVAAAAERLGISEMLDRKPGALSGGQRQRVALARALVRRPKVFLFDEPLSNLDAALRLRVRAEIKKLHEELGATFLYVTHDQAEALTLATQVAVLDGGVLQQVASPRAIYDDPDRLFVARFFGAPPLNVLPGPALGFPENEVVGIRPERLEARLGEAPRGEGSVLEGRVYLVEPMGSETWLTVDTAAGPLTARAPATLEAESGDPAWVRLDRNLVLRFDAKTGERVRAPQ